MHIHQKELSWSKKEDIAEFFASTDSIHIPAHAMVITRHDSETLGKSVTIIWPVEGRLSKDQVGQLKAIHGINLSRFDQFRAKLKGVN